jgi:release factor glutamine methyltransferase
MRYLQKNTVTSVNLRFFRYKYSDFIGSQQKHLSTNQLQLFESYCGRRLQREPVQYILGDWDFFGNTFICRAPTLIPRPETEELIENILQSTKLSDIRKPNILDVGCGSGVIGITLAAQLPEATVTAIDLSSEAVALSVLNVRGILGDAELQRYKCLHQSFDEFVNHCRKIGEWPEFDLIVSNPPYIPSIQIPGLQQEILGFEDMRALDGGPDGMDIIRQLLQRSSDLFRANGKCNEMWLEVDPSHPEQIRDMCRSPDSKFAYLSGITDLNGLNRFARLRRSI